MWKETHTSKLMKSSGMHKLQKAHRERRESTSGLRKLRNRAVMGMPCELGLEGGEFSGGGENGKGTGMRRASAGSGRWQQDETYFACREEMKDKTT